MIIRNVVSINNIDDHVVIDINADDKSIDPVSIFVDKATTITIIPDLETGAMDALIEQ